MSVRRLAAEQPANFRFSAGNLSWARRQLKKYPKTRKASAVVPLLWQAQKQNDNWLPRPAIEYVAKFLDMPVIRVMEIATFYSMFNLQPVGRHFVQLCGTTPCWLRGADDLKAVCRTLIGPERTVSEDGLFSWAEVECLGACCNAPMVQINDDYYEDLDARIFTKLLGDLRAGKQIKTGSQTGREGSAPSNGPTTLLDPKLYNAAGFTPKTKRSAKSAAKAAKPKFLKSPRSGAGDDLKRIKGIGPKLEGILNDLGVFHFHQIAAWSKGNVAWVDGHLRFKGRIEREKWIAQARKLAGRG